MKDRKHCDNCRGISLLSVPGKVLALLLMERLQAIIKPQLIEALCGFRKGRSTMEHIWVDQADSRNGSRVLDTNMLCQCGLLNS